MAASATRAWKRGIELRMVHPLGVGDPTGGFFKFLLLDSSFGKSYETTSQPPAVPLIWLKGEGELCGHHLIRWLYLEIGIHGPFWGDVVASSPVNIVKVAIGIIAGPENGQVDRAAYLIGVSSPTLYRWLRAGNMQGARGVDVLRVHDLSRIPLELLLGADAFPLQPRRRLG